MPAPNPDPVAPPAIPAAFPPAPSATAPPTPLSLLASILHQPPQLRWESHPSQQPPSAQPHLQGADPDPVFGTPPPPPPGRPAGAGDGVDCFLEPTPELLARVAAPSTGFNAVGAAAAFIASNGAGWLACFRDEATQGRTEHSLPRGPAAAGLEAEVTAMPWEEVKSRRPRPPAKHAAFTARSSPPEWIRGLCFHCLCPRHRAIDCRDPVVCRRCFRSGHKARFCTHAPRPHLRPGASKLRKAPPPPPRAPLPAAPPRPPQAALPPLPAAPPLPPQAVMGSTTAAWSGDHSARPEVFAVVHNTPTMLMEIALLESNAVVAWFDRNRRASTSEVAAFIADKIGALQPDVVVVLHHPEKFLVRFVHRHHAELAVSRRELMFGDTKLQLRAWRLEAHTEHVNMRHHVRLCLEGLPLYAWEELAVAKAIGSGCSIDYIEPASQLKTETKILALWAWTPCPSKVPRVSWITLPARNGGAPVYGRKGLEHRILVHLDIHEDPSSGNIVSKPNSWRYHIVDGENHMRDRHERISRPVRHDRRDRDDEGDRDREGDRDGRRGRDGRDAPRGGQGLGARIRRSLSRTPREEQRGSGRDDRDDRRGGRDGHRHADNVGQIATPAAPLLLGSGSASYPEAIAAELLPVAQAPPAPKDGGRGRSPARQQRPSAARRLSQEARTPPASPPRSPTSVLRASPTSKRDAARAERMAYQERSPALIELCSPTAMLRPLISISPVRPPGFERSPTPLLPGNDELQRTPTSPRARPRTAVDDLPAGLAALVLPGQETELPEQLFAAREPALLGLATSLPSLLPPTDSPPRRLVARRKTMAGVKICNNPGGISLQRVRRPAVRPEAVPVAKLAERLVCRSLGITRDEEDVTEATLDAFSLKFKEQLTPEIIVAMREFFQLDNGTVNAVEEALIGHGGEATMEPTDAGSGEQELTG